MRPSPVGPVYDRAVAQFGIARSHRPDLQGIAIKIQTDALPTIWSERKLLMVNSRMVALGITAGALGIFMAGTAALGGAQAGSSSAVGTESGERTIEDGGTGPYKAIAVSNSSIT